MPLARRSSAVARDRAENVRRWLAAEDRGRLLALTLVAVVVAALMLAFPGGEVGAAALLVPLILSDRMLSPRRVPRFVVFLVTLVAITTFVEFERDLAAIPVRRWVSLAVVLVSVGIVLGVASRRTRLGVGGLTVDRMLLDLQERIGRQATLPTLPTGWYAEMASRSAGGTSFAGDFVVAHRETGGSRLGLVVVDVSGKGVDAGARSLVLSGALSALLASTPPESFLEEANAFVLRQGWVEDFATAVHLAVDLDSGDYVVRNAGHPPAVLFDAGAGRWEPVATAQGPLLGMSSRATFPAARGRLDPHDAMLLFTDGLVERRRRDIGLGIDRLVGEAERRIRQGFRGSAQGLVDRLGADGDDCALVVLERL